MDLPQTIGFEIKMLSNLIQRKLNDETLDDGEVGWTGMQGWIIGYLRANEERLVFQRDLEKYFNIRRATVTGVLQLMERKGLITREAVDFDARLKKISLTHKAITLLEPVVHRVYEVEDNLRRGLSQEEITTFFSIVDKLKKNL